MARKKAGKKTKSTSSADGRLSKRILADITTRDHAGNTGSNHRKLKLADDTSPRNSTIQNVNFSLSPFFNPKLNTFVHDASARPSKPVSNQDMADSKDDTKNSESGWTKVIASSKSRRRPDLRPRIPAKHGSMQPAAREPTDLRNGTTKGNRFGVLALHDPESAVNTITQWSSTQLGSTSASSLKEDAGIHMSAAERVKLNRRGRIGLNFDEPHALGPRRTKGNIAPTGDDTGIQADPEEIPRVQQRGRPSKQGPVPNSAWKDLKIPKKRKRPQRRSRDSDDYDDSDYEFPKKRPAKRGRPPKVRPPPKVRTIEGVQEAKLLSSRELLEGTTNEEWCGWRDFEGPTVARRSSTSMMQQIVPFHIGFRNASSLDNESRVSKVDEKWGVLPAKAEIAKDGMASGSRLRGGLWAVVDLEVRGDMLRLEAGIATTGNQVRHEGEKASREVEQVEHEEKAEPQENVPPLTADNASDEDEEFEDEDFDETPAVEFLIAMDVTETRKQAIDSIAYDLIGSSPQQKTFAAQNVEWNPSPMQPSFSHKTSSQTASSYFAKPHSIKSSPLRHVVSGEPLQIRSGLVPSLSFSSIQESFERGSSAFSSSYRASSWDRSFSFGGDGGYFPPPTPSQSFRAMLYSSDNGENGMNDIDFSSFLVAPSSSPGRQTGTPLQCGDSNAQHGTFRPEREGNTYHYERTPCGRGKRRLLGAPLDSRRAPAQNFKPLNLFENLVYQEGDSDQGDQRERDSHSRLGAGVLATPRSSSLILSGPQELNSSFRNFGYQQSDRFHEDDDPFMAPPAPSDAKFRPFFLSNMELPTGSPPISSSPPPPSINKNEPFAVQSSPTIHPTTSTAAEYQPLWSPSSVPVWQHSEMHHHRRHSELIGYGLRLPPSPLRSSPSAAPAAYFPSTTTGSSLPLLLQAPAHSGCGNKGEKNPPAYNFRDDAEGFIWNGISTASSAHQGQRQVESAMNPVPGNHRSLGHPNPDGQAPPSNHPYDTISIGNHPQAHHQRQLAQPPSHQQEQLAAMFSQYNYPNDSFSQIIYSVDSINPMNPSMGSQSLGLGRPGAGPGSVNPASGVPLGAGGHSAAHTPSQLIPAKRNWDQQVGTPSNPNQNGTGGYFGATSGDPAAAAAMGFAGMRPDLSKRHGAPGSQGIDMQMQGMQGGLQDPLADLNQLLHNSAQQTLPYHSMVSSQQNAPVHSLHGNPIRQNSGDVGVPANLNMNPLSVYAQPIPIPPNIMSSGLNTGIDHDGGYSTPTSGTPGSASLKHPAMSLMPMLEEHLRPAPMVMPPNHQMNGHSQPHQLQQNSFHHQNLQAQNLHQQQLHQQHMQQPALQNPFPPQQHQQNFHHQQQQQQQQPPPLQPPQQQYQRIPEQRQQQHIPPPQHQPPLQAQTQSLPRPQTQQARQISNLPPSSPLEGFTMVDASAAATSASANTSAANVNLAAKPESSTAQNHDSPSSSSGAVTPMMNLNRPRGRPRKGVVDTAADDVRYPTINLKPYSNNIPAGSTPKKSGAESKKNDDSWDEVRDIVAVSGTHVVYVDAIRSGSSNPPGVGAFDNSEFPGGLVPWKSGKPDIAGKPRAIVITPAAATKSNLNGLRVFGNIGPAKDRWVPTPEEFSHREYLTNVVNSYFLDPSGEYTILIQNGKVVQKSYGSEKRYFSNFLPFRTYIYVRFLCPYPQILLLGRGWTESAEETQDRERQMSAIQAKAISLRRKLKGTSGTLPLNSNDLKRAKLLKLSLVMADEADGMWYPDQRARKLGTSSSATSTTPSTPIVGSDGGLLGSVQSSANTSMVSTPDIGPDGESAGNTPGDMPSTPTFENRLFSGAFGHIFQAEVANGVMRADLISRTTKLRDGAVTALDVEMPPDSGEEEDGASNNLHPSLQVAKPKHVTKAVFRQIFVSDSEQRRAFSLFIRIHSLDDEVMGTFRSEPIKVISKPSKKKQTKDPDLCLYSGSMISLFNRVRAQNVSTRFLSSDVHGNHFELRSATWEAWYIWALDDPRLDPTCLPGESPVIPAPPPSETNATSNATTSIQAPLVLCTAATRFNARIPENPTVAKFRNSGVAALDDSMLSPGAKPGGLGAGSGDPRAPNRTAVWLRGGRPLSYGDAVILQNAVTGLTTVPLILRVVDGKNKVVVEPQNTDEPVRGDALSQLHKVALGILGKDSMYFGVNAMAKPEDVPLPSDMEFDANIVGGSKMGSLVSPVLASPSSLTTRFTLEEVEAERRRFRGNPDNEYISEQSIWTIVGVDHAEYSFWLPPPEISASRPKALDGQAITPYVDNRLNPLPCPTIISVTAISSQVLLITGEGFTRAHQCFIGTIMARRICFRCEEVLEVDVSNLAADVEVLKGSGHRVDQASGNDSMEERIWPILIVRADGVVYRTGYYVRF
ncbi:hypothetical protein HDU97_007818 [Phlyctochytrium planicorne]|nr:hypothetical protein HDU97_007818 [Phlyctochytrium planicorne]